MFTAKVYRHGPDGSEEVSVYSCQSFQVLRACAGLENGEAFVIMRQANDDQPCVTVTNREPEEGRPAYRVVIENANGKTTELIRAFN